jgi:hypothetical protein
MLGAPGETVEVESTPPAGFEFTSVRRWSREPRNVSSSGATSRWRADETQTWEDRQRATGGEGRRSDTEAQRRCDRSTSSSTTGSVISGAASGRLDVCIAIAIVRRRSS